jgi:hypothetical protein
VKRNTNENGAICFSYPDGIRDILVNREPLHQECGVQGLDEEILIQRAVRWLDQLLQDDASLELFTIEPMP